MSGVIVGAGLVAATSVTGTASTSCTTSWTNAHGGDWSDASNWTHGVPNSGVDACITLPGTYTVTVQGFDSAARSLDLGGSDGTQTVFMDGTCTQGPGSLSLAADSLVAINGVVTLGTSGCEVPELTISGGSLTNDGSIETLPGAYPLIRGDLLNNAFVDLSGGEAYIGTWTNRGTISVATGVSFDFGSSNLVNDGSIDAAGTGSLVFYSGSTYTQATGRLRGTAPVVLDEGHVAYVGGGAGTVTIRSSEATISGNLGPRQTLVVGGGCGSFADLVADGDWTNRGTIVLGSQCSFDAELFTHGTLTNLGTIRTTGSRALGFSDLSGALVNHGLFSVGAGSNLSVFGSSFVNAPDGTLGIELASTRSYGAMNVFSPIALGGVLALSTRGTFWPRSGTTFNIIVNQFGALTGKFAKVTGRSKRGQSVALHVQYLSDEVNLNAS